jgi:PAS domain S-box-containing protein
VLLDAYDENDLIVAWNAECERVSGYRAAEIIGNPQAMSMLYPDSEYRALMLSEAQRRRHEDYSSVWDLIAKDGSRKTIEWFNVGARMSILGWREWSVGIDITERRRLEDALREAAQHEQRRLGRELHDGLGQELTGLSLLATALAREPVARDPALTLALQNLASIAARAIATCKNIARGLGGIRKPQESLTDALRELINGLSEQSRDIRFAYVDTIQGTLRISAEACNHVFRIVQEAVSNALKHAAARYIHVEFTVDAEWVRVEVCDDGCGITPPAGQAGGMGLASMRDRASAIGARLVVAPAAAQGGTFVQLECPNLDIEPNRRR